MPLPVVAVTRPHDLINTANGRLPDGLLVEVRGGAGRVGRLHPRAAEAWDALSDEAAHAGIILSFTGTYRDMAGQIELFTSRYTRSLFGTRRWAGARWRHTSGASAAVPGTSTHGWGLAVDGAVVIDGAVVAFPPAVLAWLVTHAARFGWTWELQSEPWHLVYRAGDDVPALVVALRPAPTPLPAGWPTPLPPPTTAPLTTEDDDMRLVLGDGPSRDQDPALTAEQNVTGNGAALCVVGPTGKTWVRSAQASTAYRALLGEPVRMPQAALDAVPLVGVTH